MNLINAVKKYNLTLLLLFFLTVQIKAQVPPENKNMTPQDTDVYFPVPKVVSPGIYASIPPPSDAIVLFDGRNLNKWVDAKTGGPAQWIVNNGILTVKPGANAIRTKQKFEDFQLHLEFREPFRYQNKVIKNKTGKAFGNSGVFLQSLYEVQILDSYGRPIGIYVNGQCGSIYKQFPPLVNVSRPPGRWQSYDIIFKAPRFNDDGSLKSPARVTVFQNGILIQNNVKLKGRTLFVGHPYYKKHGPMPLLLQNHHGDPVSFRNIWIRRLN